MYLFQRFQFLTGHLIHYSFFSLRSLYNHLLLASFILSCRDRLRHDNIPARLSAGLISKNDNRSHCLKPVKRYLLLFTTTDSNKHLKRCLRHPNSHDQTSPCINQPKANNIFWLQLLLIYCRKLLTIFILIWRMFMLKSVVKTMLLLKVLRSWTESLIP